MHVRHRIYKFHDIAISFDKYVVQSIAAENRYEVKQCFYEVILYILYDIIRWFEGIKYSYDGTEIVSSFLDERHQHHCRPASLGLSRRTVDADDIPVHSRFLINVKISRGRGVTRHHQFRSKGGVWGGNENDPLNTRCMNATAIYLKEEVSRASICITPEINIISLWWRRLPW